MELGVSAEELGVSAEELGVLFEDPLVLSVDLIVGLEVPMMVVVEEHLVVVAAEKVVQFVSFQLWQALLAFEELLVSLPLTGRTKSRE